MFVIGYIFIALEHQTGINKTAIALLLGILLWVMYIFSGPQIIVGADPAAFQNFIHQHPAYEHLSPLAQVREYILNWEIIDHLGNISEILFYLIGALTIVETIDVHQGFDGITRSVKTKNKKKLLWLVAFITFFMSSVLDNMTSAIVMMMLIQKLLSEQRERWIFGSIIIIAANAGGAWTPIGDVTTIMLWINDNITSGNIMKGLFLPSVISLAIPVWLVSYSLKSNSITTSSPTSGVSSLYLGKQEQTSILIIGILCLLAVPIFKSLTDLPPFAGILFTLGFLWFYTDCLYNRKKTDSTGLKYRIPDVLTKVDFSTILFFFGILMAVAALEAIGLLHQLSDLLNSGIHNVYIITGIIGFLSSVIDNVPLVAAAMGMYPLTAPATAGGISETAYLLNFVSDGNFWKLLAYCAGTGGSILIIGSAAGVVVMGLEKISFTWYMRHISWIAITGFLVGIGIYYLQNLIF